MIEYNLGNGASCHLILEPKDASGDPAAVHDVAWSVQSGAALVTTEQISTTDMKVTALDAVGDAVVKVDALNSVNQLVQEFFTLHVVAGPATSLNGKVTPG